MSDGTIMNDWEEYSDAWRYEDRPAIEPINGQLPPDSPLLATTTVSTIEDDMSTEQTVTHGQTTVVEMVRPQ